MTRKDLKEAKNYYSEKASDVTRQLNLAGLGIIWIFRVGGENGGGVLWDDFFLLPMALLACSLGLELWHYVYFTHEWSSEYRKCIKAGLDEDAEIPNWDSSIVETGNKFFWAKVSLTVIAFAMLIGMIADALF